MQTMIGGRHQSASFVRTRAKRQFSCALLIWRNSSSPSFCHKTSVCRVASVVETSLDMCIVVVKMDIEGAEYSLLPHLLDRGAWVSLSRYCSSNRHNAATDQPGCVTGRIPPISSNSRGIGYVGWRRRSVARSWSVNAMV